MYYITSILVPRGRWDDFVCIGEQTNTNKCCGKSVEGDRTTYVIRCSKIVPTIFIIIL